MVRILDLRLGIGLHGKLSDERRADRVWEVLMRAWAAYAVGRRSWYESGGRQARNRWKNCVAPFHDVHAGAGGVVRLMRAPVDRPPLVQMYVLTVKDATSEEQKLSPCFLRYANITRLL
jgi:hypothetical protein